MSLNISPQDGSVLPEGSSVVVHLKQQKCDSNKNSLKCCVNTAVMGVFGLKSD